MSSKQKVDLVYTWVNGEDLEYQKLSQSYSDNPKDSNPERFRDSFQLLKYSLRSVEKYAPWVNQIYIVTCRPQVPDWLDSNHSKITIIHHDEIFDQEDLPTFNYNVIESYIHLIPNLTSDFLYLNDDFLFGNEVSLSDFFTNDGKVIIHGTLLGENLEWRIYNKKNDIIGLGIVEHSPILIRKTWWEDMQLEKAELIREMKTHKFREDSNVMLYKLYRWYALKFHKNNTVAINVFDVLRMHVFHKMINDLTSQRRGLNKIKSKKPKFYCLNDDLRDSPNPEVIVLVKNFLEEMYPEISSYELS